MQIVPSRSGSDELKLAIAGVGPSVRTGQSDCKQPLQRACSLDFLTLFQPKIWPALDKLRRLRSGSKQGMWSKLELI